MKFYAAALVLLAVVGISAFQQPTHHSDLTSDYSYETYVQEYRKELDPGRAELFAVSLAKVLEQNARPGQTWKAAINDMSDWTEAEKKALRGYHKAAGHSHKQEMLGAAHVSVLESKDPIESFPKSIDWRNSVPPVLTAIKNQGQCGKQTKPPKTPLFTCEK